MRDPFIEMDVFKAVARALEDLDLSGPKESVAYHADTSSTSGRSAAIGREVLKHLDRLGYEIVRKPRF